MVCSVYGTAVGWRVSAGRGAVVGDLDSRVCSVICELSLASFVLGGGCLDWW